jgi:diaminopimelate epimerase
VIDAATARALADRRTGIGCDQLILIEPAHDPAAQIFMRILNADGSEAEACGNGTRCIARLLAQESGETRIRIETTAGLLDAELTPDGDVAVDMGPARTAWHEIPLAREMDTARTALALGPLTEPVCTNIGNPHATFFVPEAEAIDLAALGPRLEHDKLFPERANIGVATILDRAGIRLRVWERGAGITRACGTGACAVCVAGVLTGQGNRKILAHLPGGDLTLEWRESDGNVYMTGPATEVFSGEWPSD